MSGYTIVVVIMLIAFIGLMIALVQGDEQPAATDTSSTATFEHPALLAAEPLTTTLESDELASPLASDESADQPASNISMWSEPLPAEEVVQVLEPDAPETETILESLVALDAGSPTEQETHSDTENDSAPQATAVERSGGEA